MALLRHCLEDKYSGDLERDSVPDEDEAEVLDAELMSDVADANEIEAHVADTVAAAEAYCQLTSELNYVIEKRCVSAESLALFKYRAKMLSNEPTYSIESYEPASSMNQSDLLEEHRVVLESLSDFGAAIANTIVLEFKHYGSFFADTLRSVETRLTKYKTKVMEARALYETKKEVLEDDERELRLDELWYFFSNDKGQIRNFKAALEKDTNVSKYILDEYMKDLIDLYKKASSVISNAKLTSDQDQLATLRKVENLGRPCDKFKKQYLGGRPNLDVMGLYVKEGKTGVMPNVRGIKQTGIGEVARRSAVKEDWSLKHGMIKVANKTLIGSMIITATNNTLTFKKSDIDMLLKAAEAYISNVEAYMVNLQRFLKESQGVEQVVTTRLFRKNDIPHNGSQLVMSLMSYLTAIIYAAKFPSTQEAARSVKGARYCMYVAKRMIWMLD